MFQSLTAHLKVPVKLIGIHGHAGSGKDTAAMYLHNKYSSTYIEAFADPLKEACAKLFGVSEESFYDSEQKEKIQAPWNVSPRMIAQFVGTELVRDHMWKLIFGDSNDFWVRRLAYKLSNKLPDDDCSYSAEDIVIIPDVRFQNEYDWIIEQGGIIIHLTRPGQDGTVGIPSHKSEAGIKFTSPEDTFLVENTGTIEELEQKVDRIYRDFCEYYFGGIAESAESSDETDSTSLT